MNTIGVVLALFALVVVAVVAYRAGYRRGDAELRRQRQSTDVALPRWRRVAGWAAYTCSGLLLCLFLALAFQYAKRWGWAVLMAAWVLWFALFMGGICLAEWCWKPYREAQERLRHEQTEILRALEERANEKNST
jgi:Na+/melibiose symporter-like transporter